MNIYYSCNFLSTIPIPFTKHHLNHYKNTGFTSFYVQVLEVGTISPSDEIRLIEQNEHHITIAFANEIIHHDKHNIEEIQRILTVDSLSESW
ncbi:3-alpha domain-containing protein [Bacillus sp. GB_SG_008]|uniref:3-alpha domain-containing protein n=1 Tax=Bacillus sp. GB_SG_008 TaxID=3454627 RepID=UPI003F84EF44